MTKYGACETIEEIEAVEGEFLTPRQVSRLLKCDPYTINVQAKLRPEILGFPIVRLGSRVKIPKRAFLNFLNGNVQREVV
jgi:hypothetical protein